MTISHSKIDCILSDLINKCRYCGKFTSCLVEDYICRNKVEAIEKIEKECKKRLSDKKS